MMLNTAVLRRLWSAFAILLLLAGCGGGGSGDNSDNGRYSISLSTGSLTFSAAQFTTPAAQTVTATFKGDGVVVGTLPGQFQPSWLRVSSDGVTGNQATFSISVAPGNLAPGTYAFTLRFLSGSADGSNVVYRDLAITLNLREGFQASGPEIRFNAVESGPYSPSAGIAFQITGENVSWSIVAPAWLQLSATSGNARATVTVRPNMTGLAEGRYSDWIRVNDSVSGGYSLLLAVVEVGVPQLTASTTDFTIALNSQTPFADTHQVLLVSDSALGQNATRAIAWTAASNSPLLLVGPASGSTAGTPTALVVDMDLDRLNALRTGTHTPTATISYPYYNSRYLSFNLNVRLPRANSVEPYILATGTPSTVTLLGEDFTQDDIGLLRLNGQALSAQGASAALTNDRQISLSLPALAAGYYNIAFYNELGLPRSAAAFKVAALPAAPGAGEMIGTGNRVKLLFDRARNRLYGIDTREGEIERYEWDGMQWSAQSAVSLPRLKDAVLMRDGRHLAASTEDSVSSVDLDNGVASVIPATTAMSCSSAEARSVTAPVTGSLFTSMRNACGNLRDVLELDLLSGALSGPYSPSINDWYFPSATLATSGDGRVLAIGSTGTSGGHYGLFDVITRTVIDRGDSFRFPQYYYYRLELDRTGTKVLINNYEMRDRAGTGLGWLPFNSAAALSADGTRAYVYIGSGTTGQVKILDTSTAVGSGNVFPQIGADIPVTSDMGLPDNNSPYNPNYVSFGMALSADEQLLFISGSTRIVAIDLP